METSVVVGPVGERVAENVKRLRGRVPVRELSARLGGLGRKMLPSAITKIEQGARRVDADDLVALALVLGVTPNRLLLCDREQAGETDGDMVLSPQTTVLWRHAWAWADGDRPLEGPDGPHGGRDFRVAHRPHVVASAVPLLIFGEGSATELTLSVNPDALGDALDAGDDAMPWESFLELLDIARRQVEAMVDATAKPAKKGKGR